MITLSGFTLSNEIGSSEVTGGQQLPLCIFAAKFTKVPAGIMGENMKRSKWNKSSIKNILRSFGNIKICVGDLSWSSPQNRENSLGSEQQRTLHSQKTVQIYFQHSVKPMFVLQRDFPWEEVNVDSLNATEFQTKYLWLTTCWCLNVSVKYLNLRFPAFFFKRDFFFKIRL